MSLYSLDRMHWFLDNQVSTRWKSSMTTSNTSPIRSLATNFPNLNLFLMNLIPLLPIQPNRKSTTLTSMMTSTHQTHHLIYPHLERDIGLRSVHPKSAQFKSGEKVTKSNEPIHDIGIEVLATHISLISTHKQNLTGNHLPQQPEKYIGKVPIVSTPSLPHKKESTEQKALQNIWDIISYDPISESHLQFTPRWIV